MVYKECIDLKIEVGMYKGMISKKKKRELANIISTALRNSGYVDLHTIYDAKTEEDITYK